MRPALIRPFAQPRSSSGVRFGIAAVAAGLNGASAIAATTVSASSAAGSWTNAIATNVAAPARSEMIITRRRS